MTCLRVTLYGGRLRHALAELSNTQLEGAPAIIAACFEAWRAARLLRARRGEFVQPVKLKADKLVAEALGEVELGAGTLDRIAGLEATDGPCHRH